MLSQLDDYDWEQVFNYATPTECDLGHKHGPESVVTERVSTAGFDREDVVEIVAMDEGCNDGDDWIGVFRLKDGRFASIKAWCDYTGWG